MTERFEAIKNKLEMLDDAACKLNQTITDNGANSYFLGPVRNTLGSVKMKVLRWVLKASTPSKASMLLDAAESELCQAEIRLHYAERMIATYGTDIQVIATS